MSIDTVAPLAESKKTSYKLVPPKDIRINIDRNVRELGVYNPNHHAMKPLIQSMLSVGFAEGNPCTVVAENGYYDLLQGHRRYTAACEAIRLRDAMSSEDRVKIPEIKGIPCIVMTGLSESDKLQVIVDHGNIATLNDIEKLECVRRLVHAGMGRAQIAAKMGESASWVQLRMELITLPPSVHKEWVKKEHNKSLPPEKRETLTFPVGWSDIKELHTASVEDKKQGIIDVATGSSFRKVLGDLKVKGVTGTRRGTKEEGGAFNSAQIRNLANACHRAWLKRLFLYLSGDNQSGSISDIITNLELAHDAKFGEPSDTVAVVETVTV